MIESQVASIEILLKMNNSFDDLIRSLLWGYEEQMRYLIKISLLNFTYQVKNSYSKWFSFMNGRKSNKIRLRKKKKRSL